MAPSHAPSFAPTRAPTRAPAQPQAAKVLTYKIDFGTPGTHVQFGYTKLGGSDGGSGTVTGTVGPYTFNTAGYTHIRGNYDAISGKYEYMSNLLRSQLLCNANCEMKTTISGLTPGATYSIKTWHHDNNCARGGVKFSLQWSSMTAAVSLQQSSNGATPDPPTSYTALVTADSLGKAVLKMTKSDGSSAHMDLNGMEITGLTSKTEQDTLPGGDGWIELGEWRIGIVDNAHFSFSHTVKKKTAVIFRSDGTQHKGPRDDYGLWSRSSDVASNIFIGDGFIQFGNAWRLGDVDGAHFSLTHSSGNTAMIWRNDGTEHPGPRTDFSTWSKSLTPSRVAQGARFVELGALWRVGDVDGTHMSVGTMNTQKTAVIYRNDGTIHPGPRTDYNVFDRAERMNVPWYSGYIDKTTPAPHAQAPGARR